MAANTATTGVVDAVDVKTEVDDINARLQWCLSTPSLSSDKSTVSYLNPELILASTADHLDQCIKELCMCLRRHECKCADPRSCTCDSDDTVDIASCRFSSHSNCRYTIELVLKQRQDCRTWPENHLLRLFTLDHSTNETPLVDISSKKWIFCGDAKSKPTPKPTKPKSAAKEKEKESDDVDISFGTVLIHPRSAADKPVLFNLLDHVQVSDRSILISFDYMSFH